MNAVKGMVLAAGLSLAGCSSLNLTYQHISHPLAGPPLKSQVSEEWLDQVMLCGRKEKGRFFLENCIGYKFNQGLEGPEETYTLHTGLVLWKE